MATDEEFAELDQIIVDSEEAKSQGNILFLKYNNNNNSCFILFHFIIVFFI